MPAQVMPDNKTAYITDDGTNVAFFKFVADKAGDMSAGGCWRLGAWWLIASRQGSGGRQHRCVETPQLVMAPASMARGALPPSCHTPAHPPQAGTLYGAKATQTDDVDGGAFDLTWIELGHLTQDEVAVSCL